MFFDWQMRATFTQWQMWGEIFYCDICNLSRDGVITLILPKDHPNKLNIAKKNQKQVEPSLDQLKLSTH